MKIKYFDRAIEWLFMALLFLSPVIFDRRIGIVFSGTKSATIRLFILLILTIWAIKLLLGGKHVFKRTVLDWPIISYMLAISAATITSVNFMVSLFGFYGRYEGLVTWYAYALFFFIAVNYFRGFDNLKRLAAIIIPTSAAMAVYGIIQRQGIDPYVWGGVITWQRVIGTIGQPNFLSAYMIMAFFVVLFFLFPNKDVAPVYEEKIDKKAKHVKNNKIEKKKTSFDYKKYLPVVYFLLVPILFIVMIYTQTGQNVFVWYLFFVLMSVFTILFALKYEEVPSVVLQSVAGITLVLIYICNFYTQSRGGYLGFGVGFVFFILLAPRKILFDNWKPLAVLLVALFSITLFTSINPAYSPFERFAGEIKVSSGDGAEIKEKNSDGNVELSGAAGSRGETWKSAFGIIADNPIFGIGPETLKMVFPRYETDLFRFKEAFHVKQDRSHNETFDVPVTKGLISFFVYISILFLVFKEGIRKQKKLSDDKKIFMAGTLAAIASYLIQNQFSFGVVAITSLFWVLWAFVVNIDSEPDEKNDDRKISFDDIPWIPVGCLVLAFLVLGYVSILQFEADKEFKIGKTYMDMRRFNEAFPYFKKAIAFFPFEGGTVTHYAITLLNGSLPDGNKTLQDEALKTFEYGMKIDPYNADNFYISSRIYLMRGDLPKAIDYTSKALKIDPYYAEAYLTLAMISENQKNFPQAQKYYEEAYRLNPNLNESKIKVAFKLMQEGKLDEAFNLLQEMVIANPQNIDVRNALATVYLRKGNLERAKEEFLQVLQIDPNNAYAKNMIRR